MRIKREQVLQNENPERQTEITVGDTIISNENALSEPENECEYN
jgi:hypothetical protein